MSASSTEFKSVAESKLAVIQSFERYYARQSIVDTAIEFIEKGANNIKIQLYTMNRLTHRTDQEKSLLAEWTHEYYGQYLEENMKDFERLSPSQCLWLGYMHTFEIHKGCDKAKATLLFQQASSQGCRLASYEVASLICQHNLTEGIKLLKACEHPLADDFLSVFLEESDPKESLAYYKLAAAAGVSMAHRNLGLAYRYAQLGLPQDLSKAHFHFTEAATSNPAALLSLGKMYHECDEFIQHKGLAKQFFEAAITRARVLNGKAHDCLGSILLNENNLTKAALYFRIAERNDKLWDMFEQNKAIPEVCYHAAISLQNSPNETQKNATRAEFNKLLKTNPDVVIALYHQSADTPKSLQPLIDIGSEIYDEFARKYAVLTEQHAMPIDIAKNVMAFEYFSPEEMLEKELTAKKWIIKQKALRQTLLYRLFGDKKQLQLIDAAENHTTSYRTAFTRMT